MQISGSSYIDILDRYRVRTRVVNDGRGEAVAPLGAVAPVEKGSEQSLEQQTQQQVQSLKNRDREVRSHEQAHLTAAGTIAISGAHFQYTTGPDGQRYATGGDVSIDTSAVANDPAATLRKAETIRRAAMAPAQPSGQDYSVASQAAAMAAKASVELIKAQQEPSRSGSLLNVTA